MRISAGVQFSQQPKKTTVVNKHETNDFDVYIGRETKWGNPFSHLEGTSAQFVVKDRDEAVEKYREWILKQDHLLNSLHELKGKKIACFCAPKSCHGHVLADLADNGFKKSSRPNPPKILECSTKGDSRYSALCAKVTAFGKTDTIENFYQLSKRFGDYVPKNFKDAKGKNPSHIHINGLDLETKYLSQWYKLLWVKYLDKNPYLVEHAKTFDEYNDIFKGRSINCQADVIRQYVRQGRQSLLDECTELISLLK